MTTAWAIGCTSTSRCPNETPCASSPRTVTTVGLLATVSAGTVMTVAWPNDANARALTRSAGVNERPSLASPRWAGSTAMPGAASVSTVTFPSASGCRRPDPASGAAA